MTGIHTCKFNPLVVHCLFHNLEEIAYRLGKEEKVVQTVIDFLANNYLWFIIIALILIFALIGYLVDTSERASQSSNLEEQMLEENKDTASMENSVSLNMDMGPEELDKDVIVMPTEIENPLSLEEENEDSPELLDIE